MHPAAMNPAALSPAVTALFPPGAVAAELRHPGSPDLLLPREARHLARAVPARAQEFAAGRLCARRALAEFGIRGGFPIEVGDNRQPVWPAGMVGSITHTTGFAAAVAAQRQCAESVGLDSEVVGAVEAGIWSRICTAAELAWIRSLPVLHQGGAVTLVFVAKEAFYKCQYPIVEERLGFDDVSIEAAAWEAPTGQSRAAGEFRIHPTRVLALGARTAFPLAGRYLFHEGFVSAGLALAGA